MTQQSDEQPRDWRRRRRRTSPSNPNVMDPESHGANDTSKQDPTSIPETNGSRTLFSFLEPSLNTIGSFNKPVVLAGVIAIFIGLALTTFVTSMRLYGAVLIAFGVVLIGLIALIFLSSVLAAFVSRTGKYGVNTLIMLSAFIGILVVLNFISFANNTRIDTTATNQFSLDNSTKNLLGDLNQPVHAIAFYREDVTGQDTGELQQILRRSKVDDTLQELQNESGKFSYEFRDPEIEPDLARSYGITQYESIVIIGEQSGITDIIVATDADYSQLEQDLYTAILVATGQEQRTVYFLSGHGERSTNSTVGEGYTSLKAGLERDNYKVETLRWAASDESVTVPDGTTDLDGMPCNTSESCPSGTALLVIANPEGELPEAHAKALHEYLSGIKPDGTARREGARMIFLAEPDLSESFRVFLANWGVVVNKGYILDLDSSLPGSPHTLRINRYNPSAPPEIVIPRGKPLDVSFMAGAASLSTLPIPDEIRLPLPLAGTSQNSFLVDNIERTTPIQDGGNKDDIKGPFIPALYLQAVGPVGTPAPKSAPPDSQISGIVIFGDADFASNSFFNKGNGADLFLNSANYLLGDYSLVSIRDRKIVFREWNLDQNELEFVRFSSWFFLPGLMALLAALVWWFRR